VNDGGHGPDRVFQAGVVDIHHVSVELQGVRHPEADNVHPDQVTPEEGQVLRIPVQELHLVAVDPVDQLLVNHQLLEGSVKDVE